MKVAILITLTSWARKYKPSRDYWYNIAERFNKLSLGVQSL